MFAFLSAPLDTLALTLSIRSESLFLLYSLGYNGLRDEDKQALQDAGGSSVRIIF